jgi:hypothetical protein
VRSEGGLTTLRLPSDREPALKRARPADRLQCQGCRRLVDVGRPANIAYGVTRGTTHGREVITITVGRVVVHRCMLCADGEWR